MFGLLDPVIFPDDEDDIFNEGILPIREPLPRVLPRNRAG